jgi:hypothetical protein
MSELFRYIEQAFVLPAITPGIDVSGESDLQHSLHSAISRHLPPIEIRGIASDFLDKHFPSPATAPFRLGSQYLSFRSKWRAEFSTTSPNINNVISNVFDSKVGKLTASKAFLSDKALLNDTLVAVKLVTGFDRVNAVNLVSMRQVIAFLEDLTAGNLSEITVESIKAALLRPIIIPQEFVDALKAKPMELPQMQDATVDTASHDRATLVQEQLALKSAYDTIMGLQPHQFELKSREVNTIGAGSVQIAQETSEVGFSRAGQAVNAAPVFLRVAQTEVDRLGDDIRHALAKANIDVLAVPVSNAVESIKRRWQNVSRQLAPYQVPAAAKIFRVGVHLFAIRDLPATTEAAAIPAPAADFRHAITRPVGIGNLQVVRQELIDYEAGDISHIENVLEGELLRRSTRREETNELTITQETETTQAEERDQQSTSRNELSSEAQKESGQQTASSKDQTTTTDYGKLVENSKTNYARSVTDRAVNTLTQMVRLQRVQREKKTFTEEAVHELDNRQGAKKVRGIYQWVDKKYKARILNYGKRLLYDVVIPEPAAFIIDSLKNAVQPENFQLTKPIDPGISPTELDPGNYSYYAAQYGVTGSVAPPPDEFIQTVAHTDPGQKVAEVIDAFGGKWNARHFNAFSIHVPDNYKAVSGYVQKINPSVTVVPGSNPPAPNLPSLNKKQFEFFIGENYFLRFSDADITTLNHSFTMNGETGDIPVTLTSFPEIIQFNYAIGINCQCTDKAYEQWQLKTHAAIMQGYQRQLATYEDKLAQYQSAVRSQMALVQNFAHDPSIEQEELKKAFISLLLGEHFSQAYLPTPYPEAFPPDPVYVRNWGAMVAFFERAFEWENIMFTYYPYFWGRQAKWGELILIQDIDPQFEAFLKAGAARVVIPVRPGFEAALAHYQETGDIWMGEEMPDMFSEYYVSIIEEIKSRNFAPGTEVCVAEWDVKLPTTLVMLKEDENLPQWEPTIDCSLPADQ